MSEHTPTIEKIDHLLSRAEHDSGYQAFVYMRKLWPHLKMAAESHEALVKALRDLEDACERIAANRTRKVYLAMIDAGQSTDDLIELDAARLSARTLLGAVGQPGMPK